MPTKRRPQRAVPDVNDDDQAHRLQDNQKMAAKVTPCDAIQSLDSLLFPRSFPRFLFLLQPLPLFPRLVVLISLFLFLLSLLFGVLHSLHGHGNVATPLCSLGFALAFLLFLFLWRARRFTRRSWNWWLRGSDSLNDRNSGRGLLIDCQH